METMDRTWYHLPVKATFWKWYAHFFKTGKININNLIEIEPEKCQIQPEKSKIPRQNGISIIFLNY